MPQEPQIRLLDQHQQPLLEDFLGPRIESSMFLLNNSRRAGLVDRGQPLQATYLAAVEQQRLVGVAALCWNGNILLQAPRGLAALLTFLSNLGLRPVAGIIGPDHQVVDAMRLLGIHPDDLALDGPEGLYALDLAQLRVPQLLAAGVLTGRVMTGDDLTRETAWRLAYCVEALGLDDGPDLHNKCRQDMQRSLDSGQTWVLENAGQAVASSSFNAVLPEIVQVGGVYTPPGLRGRGYGRAAVAASLRASQARGTPRAVLFTEDSNQPARRAYAALGFERIDDYRVALLRQPWQPNSD